MTKRKLQEASGRIDKKETEAGYVKIIYNWYKCQRSNTG